MVFMKVNIFKGITLPDAPRFGKVFGGQFIGQVLYAIFHVFQSNNRPDSFWSFLYELQPITRSNSYGIDGLTSCKKFTFLIVNCMQALAAASKTVDSLKIVHSLHAYFLLVGDLDSKS